MCWNYNMSVIILTHSKQTVSTRGKTLQRLYPSWREPTSMLLTSSMSLLTTFPVALSPPVITCSGCLTRPAFPKVKSMNNCDRNLGEKLSSCNFIDKIMERSPTSWWRPLWRDTFRQIQWHMDHWPTWKMHQSLSTYSAAMRYLAVTADYSSDHPASSLQSPWGAPSTHTPSQQSAVSLGCTRHPYTVCSLPGVHPPSIHSLQSPWGAPSIHTQSAVSLGCTLHPYTQPAVCSLSGVHPASSLHPCTACSLPGVHPPSIHSLQSPWGAPFIHTPSQQSAVSLGCTQPAVSIHAQPAVSLGCTLHPYTVCSLPGVHPSSIHPASSLQSLWGAPSQQSPSMHSLQSPWGAPSIHTQSAVSLGCTLHPYTQPAVCSLPGVHPSSIHSLQSPWGAPSIHCVWLMCACSQWIGLPWWCVLCCFTPDSKTSLDLFVSSSDSDWCHSVAAILAG